MTINRVCANCGERVAPQVTTYCDHCGRPFRVVGGPPRPEPPPPPVPVVLPEPSPSLAGTLAVYVGEAVAINYVDALKPKVAQLVHVGDDLLAIESNGLRITFPLHCVLAVAEGAGARNFRGKQIRAQITIYHHVVYKGSVGLGLLIPFGGDQ